MPVDFSKCSVYRIDCDISELVYVGSTAQELHPRWADHKRDCRKDSKANFELYKSMKEHGVEHHHITLIEEISVENRPQLNSREGYWIRTLDTYKHGLNCRIAGQTVKEWRKTRINGIRNKIIWIGILLSFRGLYFAMKYEKPKRKSGFESSDGCSCAGPMVIHLVAPLM